MATVPTPTTQVAATVVPAATINSQGNLATYLAGRAESGGARKPLCLMRQGVAQSLTSGVAAAITFDLEDVDYDNGHSTVTNTSRYTAGTAGWYEVKVLVWFASGSATGTRGVSLRLNGTTAINSANWQVPSNAADGIGVGGTRLVFFNATDYIEAMAFQDSTGAVLTTVGGSAASMMSVHWVSV